jgi:hypothetical protein
MVGVASERLDGRTGKAGTASMVGVASERLDGRTGKAGTASMVGVASDALDVEADRQNVPVLDLVRLAL